MREIICTCLVAPKKTNSIYLGDWAIKDSEILDYKKKKVLGFIWKKKSLFIKDSIVIRKIIIQLYQKLSLSLNKTHNINYSKKFWKLLIYPWIYNYISALYFRWQCINKIKKKNNLFIFIKNLKFARNNSTNNLNLLANDNWNQKIFQEIVLFQNKNYIYQGTAKKINIKKKKNFLIFIFSLIPNFVIIQINYFISLLKIKEIFFLNTCYFFKISIFSFLRKYSFDYFYKIFLRRINVLLIQSGDQKIELMQRFIFFFKKFYRPKTKFEKFLIKKIIEDIPTSLVEDFNNYLNRCIKLRDSKIILTSYSLSEMTSDKFYIAEQVNKGSTIYLIEHGGSLATKQEHLNLETTVVDKKITWFKPLIKKHFQLPTHPYHYLNLRKKDINKKNKNIIVIGPGDYKHVHNCTFRLKSSRLLGVMDDINKFYNFLNINIKKEVFIKPHPNKNETFNFMKFYDKIFNKNIVKETSLINTLKKARIIVCTYAETTFALSMYISIPTILVYNKNDYIFHNKTISLIKDLEKNKIIFHNPVKAAKHINEIYEHPEAWYNSAEVKKVRNKFLKIALGIVNPRDIDKEKNSWKKILK